MDKDNIQTEFNSNQSTIYRISELLDQCNYFSRMAVDDGNSVSYLNKYLTTMRRVRTEIWPKLTNKERQNIMKQFLKLKRIGSVVVCRNTPHGKSKTIDRVKFNRVLTALDYIENNLRCYADAKGMLLKNIKTMDETNEL